MIYPRLADIEDIVNSQSQNYPTFKMAVLRNVTLEGMDLYLRYASMQDGLSLELQWGDYDNILQEANGLGSGIINPETQAIIVCLWLPAFSNILSFSFAAATPNQIEVEVVRIREYCSATLRALRQRSSAPILWLSFEPPAWPSYGILDARPPSGGGQRAIIAELNAFLIDELDKIGNARLVDTGQCLERVGAKEFYDWRFWHMARAPYGRSAMAEFSREVQKHVRAQVGRVRKCLILDCDNTLWGGVVGEDGVKGIKIGADHAGTAYQEFQMEVLNLHHRGVILGLCSKNNLEDVLEVLHTRRDMLLQEEHFAVMRVNWQDKATNLREIALELNIGLDSIVFVDDSDFEINLVRESLPEVIALQVSAARPYENRTLLLQGGWFDSHVLTEEDRLRAKMYRAEVKRKNLADSITDIDDYLQSLQMNITVEDVTDADLDRVAQLCQRTNQFNLTTKRYSRDELAIHKVSPESTLLLLRLSDRFGDYGVIGFCLAVNSGSDLYLDTFLMSCRALGRGVETAFLALSCEAAAAENTSRVIGSYIPTKKNAQVAHFYQQHGFKTLAVTDDKIDLSFKWERGSIIVPPHFNLNVKTQTELRK